MEVTREDENARIFEKTQRDTLSKRSFYSAKVLSQMYCKDFIDLPHQLRYNPDMNRSGSNQATHGDDTD